MTKDDLLRALWTLPDDVVIYVESDDMGGKELESYGVGTEVDQTGKTWVTLTLTAKGVRTAST